MEDAPQLAFDHDYILNSILASAAFHMYSLNSTDGFFLNAAHEYTDKALVSHRVALSNLNAYNAVPCLIAALFVTFQGRFMVRRMLPGEKYTLPTTDFDMTKGMRGLLYSTAHWIRGSNVTRAMFDWPPPMGTLWMDDSNKIDRRCFEEDVAGLESILEGLELGTGRSQPYEMAVRFLHSVQEAKVLGEATRWIQRRLQAFPVVVPWDFSDMLDRKDPRALGVPARYFVLMKKVDDAWYLKGCAEYEMRGILSLMPKDWMWAMEWPLQVMNLNSDLPGLVQSDDTVTWQAIEEKCAGLLRADPSESGYCSSLGVSEG